MIKIIYLSISKATLQSLTLVKKKKKKYVFQYLPKASKSVLVSAWKPAADTGHHTLCSPHTLSRPTP